MTLTSLALKFFGAMSYRDMCEVLGKVPAEQRIEPFSGMEFLRYLKATDSFPESGRYMLRIDEFLSHLATKNVLVEVGRTGGPILGRNYYFMTELSSLQRQGSLWLASALGPEFLFEAYSQCIVQITGVDADGDVHAGTGIAISPRWILTCAHVLTDMSVDRTQTVLGRSMEVLRTLAHPDIDVGLVEVNMDLTTLPGLSFRDPLVAEPVFTLGYPRVPLTKDASLVMQKGEVTNPCVTLLHGQSVFLYSAIARPGNSGGPVISEAGHVVGMVTEELFEEGKGSRMPFHAGIRTADLLTAISDLVPDLSLPVETFE